MILKGTQKMATARKFFVLVQCAVGKADDVGVAIVKLGEPVRMVCSISGEYDLLVELVAIDETPVNEMIGTTIHSIPGVERTNTIVAFQVYDPDWV